jgi:hypothetical protein
MTRLSFAVSVLILLSACEGAGLPSRPTPPSPTTTTAPTYTLSGEVSELTPAGLAPVEGARVEESNSRRVAMTNDDGFYSISGVHARPSAVSASKPGFVTSTRTVEISGDTRLDLRVDRIPTYTLSGVVFELTAAGRAPIEGVELYCDSCESPDGHTWKYTDAEGFYSFSSVLNGSYPLLVRKAGYEVVDPSGRLANGTAVKDAAVNGDTRFDIELVRR